MTDEDSLFYTDFLFTEYTKEPPCVHFVCSSSGYIENFFIYSNGDISYGKRQTFTDSTLTGGGVPAEAKATGDALNQKLSIATTEGTSEAYTATIPNAGPITEGFTFIMIPHTDSTSISLSLTVNGISGSLVRTDNRQGGYYTASHEAWLQANHAYLVTKGGAGGSMWLVNNSKINPDDIIGTVAIKHGGTGATTATEALTNLGAASNPNILDNWYFADPVNQRGATTYTAEDYCIDRWYFEQWSNTRPRLVLNDGFITLSCTDTTGDTNTNCIEQTIDNPGLYSGKTVTFSVKFKSVVTVNSADSPRILIRSVGADGTSVANKTITSSYANGIISITTTLQNELTHLMVIIGNYANNGGDGGFAIQMESAKLEIGSISTLANDAPPNKALELLKCQRYFWKCAGYNAYTGYKSTTAYAFIQTPVLMRTTPTATLGSTNYIYGANGRAVFSGTDIVSSIQQQGQFIRLVLNESKADTTQSSYTGYTFVTGESGMSLSAEI